MRFTAASANALERNGTAELRPNHLGDALY